MDARPVSSARWAAAGPKENGRMPTNTARAASAGTRRFIGVSGWLKGTDLDSSGLERRANPLYELRGARRVAMDAQSVDIHRDLLTGRRQYHAVAHHANSAIGDDRGIVNNG